MPNRVRFIGGIALAAITAVLALKFADTQATLSLPSHLYEEGNPYSLGSFPWWVVSGLLMGVVIGLTTIRLSNQVQQGVIMMIAATILVGAALALLAFMNGYAITLTTYAEAAGIDILVFFMVATIPALAGIFGVSMLTSRPPKRSAVDFMPDELKDAYAARANQRKRPALPGWPLGHKEHQAH